MDYPLVLLRSSFVPPPYCPQSVQTNKQQLRPITLSRPTIRTHEVDAEALLLPLTLIYVILFSLGKWCSRQHRANIISFDHMLNSRRKVQVCVDNWWTYCVEYWWLRVVFLAKACNIMNALYTAIVWISCCRSFIYCRLFLNLSMVCRLSRAHWDLKKNLLNRDQNE